MLGTCGREQTCNIARVAGVMTMDRKESNAASRAQSEFELIAELDRRTAVCERLLGEQRHFLASSGRQAAMPRAVLLEALTLEALDRRQTAAERFGAIVPRRLP